MKGVLFLFFTVMAGFPQVSLSIVQTVNCTQTWTARIPATQEVSLAISSDGSKAALGEVAEFLVPETGNFNWTVNMLYITLQPLQVWFAPLGYRSSFIVRMSSDGSYVATGLQGGGVQVLDGISGVVLWQFHADVSGYFMSRDGKYLAVLVMSGYVNKPNTLYLFRTGNGGKVWSYTFPATIGNSTSGQPLSVSDGGSRIAVLVGRSLFMLSNTNNQTLWSAEVESSVRDPTDFIGASETNVFLSPDGAYLFTTEDANATVYSASTGLVASSFTMDRDLLSTITILLDDAFSFSGDGSTLGLLSGGKLAVRDRAAGTLIFSKSTLGQASDKLPASGPMSVSLSHDGSVVAVGSSQRQVFVFDRQGDELCSSIISYRNGGFTIVKVSDDGRSIIAFVDQTISLFTLTSSPVPILIVGISVSVAAVSLAVLVLRRRKAKERTSENSLMPEASQTSPRGPR